MNPVRITDRWLEDYKRASEQRRDADVLPAVSANKRVWVRRKWLKDRVTGEFFGFLSTKTAGELLGYARCTMNAFWKGDIEVLGKRFVVAKEAEVERLEKEGTVLRIILVDFETTARRPKSSNAEEGAAGPRRFEVEVSGKMKEDVVKVLGEVLGKKVRLE